MNETGELSNRRDDLSDLAASIGAANEADVATRLRCIELAIAATPDYVAYSKVPEIVLTARRFARFATDGTAPWLTTGVICGDKPPAGEQVAD